MNSFDNRDGLKGYVTSINMDCGYRISPEAYGDGRTKVELYDDDPERDKFSGTHECGMTNFNTYRSGYSKRRH